MIIFNTIKKAEHYVKWYSKKHDYSNNGYEWSSQDTYIDGNLILIRSSGDGCGCGCDMYLYDYVTVIGRIKSYDTKSIRENKIKNIIK